MDFDPITFNLGRSIGNWAQLVGILLVLGLLLGFLLSFLSAGAAGATVFARGLKSFFQDLFSISPKRILAICGLTLKEATRRKALLVFVVFAVLLMFGGWFLTDSNDRAELQFGVHVTFMLTVISWLVLPVAIFLSCWGIPEDIRIRSLHTVVTKPTRRIEVVAGRMLGYSTMVITVLLFMGVVGYIWIDRRVPDKVVSKEGVARELKTCRVPVYGGLRFLDRQGLPKQTGINVGDEWMYRSFIEGNSAARATWWFPRITPDSIGDELQLESRFEAFRTVKGTAESADRGMEAQYFLVNDLRSYAFLGIRNSPPFRGFGDALLDGNFQTAAVSLDAAAEAMQSSPESFSDLDCRILAVACLEQTVPALTELGEDFKKLANGFLDLAEAAKEIRKLEDGTYGDTTHDDLAEQCRGLAVILRDQAETLLETMPRIEVPLPPFPIAEFHEGENVNAYPRKLTYAADNESAARFLAEAISGLNDSGDLVAEDQISPDLASVLEEQADVSAVNAEEMQQFLESELEGEALKIEDGKVAVADGRRWLTYLNQVLQEERLVSQDPAGWVVEVDLFDDLTREGVLQVDVACLDDQMYLGMARPDLFVRLKDKPFWLGYSKALLNIGLMLCLIVVIGVTASCVVKGPVSFFLTLTVFVVGQFFHPFMQEILQGNRQENGLVNSAILMVQHRNPNAGADISESRRKVVEAVDSGFFKILEVASNVVPDFQNFSNSAAYIENGFDVPWSTSVLPSLAIFFGFLIPCLLLGTAFLKFRELEAK